MIDVLDYKGQTGELPSMDDMESFIEKSENVIDYLEKTKKIIQKLHDAISDFMLDNFLALERKLRRFM